MPRLMKGGGGYDGGGGGGMRGHRRHVRRGGVIVDGDGKPVVIDASGSNDKRVRMVSFFTMIMYPLFIYIYI